MIGTEVALQDMLFCRERRADIQNMLSRKYHCPVISFCMNIPGPIKTNPEIRSAFENGKETLMKQMNAGTLSVFEKIEFHENTGDELIMAVDHPADSLKAMTTQIEETHPCGRLFDMDVIDTDGRKLSRSTYRKCILCGCQAQECARMRRHSVKAMQDKIEEILRSGEQQTSF